MRLTPREGAAHPAPLVLFGMTSGVSARGFLRGQAPFLRERGWDVALMCNEEGDVKQFAADEGMTFVPLPVERNPSWRSDLQAAFAVLRALRRLNPSVALWGSPKASLLGTAACRVLGIPAVYQVHGLRFEGSAGARRWALVAVEALTCRLATVVVPVGSELRDLLARRRIASGSRVRMLADGSCNGVAPATGSPTYRARLGLGADDVVVSFAGRITRDKGLTELADAWTVLVREHPEAHLVVAGRVDGPDPTGPVLAERLAGLTNVHLLGHVDDVDDLWASSDVMVLPSYREGLPLVVIEAAASAVPAVVSDCTGGREVVEDGVTGLVVPRFDAPALQRAMGELVADPALRRRMGVAARERALRRYDRDRLWGDLEHLLRRSAS